MNKLVFIAYIVWNVFVVLMYALDKSRARRGGRRIRETSLILPAFFMGAEGAIVGMVMFNHKTSKPKFRILVPLALGVNIALFFVIGGRIGV